MPKPSRLALLALLALMGTVLLLLYMVVGAGTGTAVSVDVEAVLDGLLQLKSTKDEPKDGDAQIQQIMWKFW